MPEHREPQSSSRGLKGGIALLLVLVTWLAVAGVGGPLVGRLSEVQRNDNASFLSETAESTEVNELSARFVDRQSLPFFVVLEREGGLEEADVAATQQWLRSVPGLEVAVQGQDALPVSDFLAEPPAAAVPSKDGEALFAPVLLDADEAAASLPDGESALTGVAEALRESLSQDLTDDGDRGLQGWVAGPAGVGADLGQAFAGIDTRLLQVTLVVVFVILLLVYRSPVLPFAAMLTSLFALSGAGLVVYPLADSGTIELNGQSQGILFILVIGAATDYALLLVARYREELHRSVSRFTAMARAWRASLAPISASAVTVVLGLLCLLLADLGSTRGLGPVGAIGITSAYLAALTLLPVLLLFPVVVLVVVVAGVAAVVGAVVAGGTGAAVAVGLVLVVAAALGVLRARALRAHSHGVHADTESGPVPAYARPPAGRWLFWPRVPHVDADEPAPVEERGVWGRVAALVSRRPRTVWVATLLVLGTLAAFVPQFEAGGLRQTDVFRERVESAVGTDVIGEHFPAGAGSPVLVIAPERDLQQVVDVVADVEGVARVVPTGAEPAGPGQPPGQPLVVDGLVQVEATLDVPSDSRPGEDVVTQLRTALDDVGDDVLVGGQTAVNLDVREASERDFVVIVPVVLAVILLVLVVLLRSLVAPVLLVVANIVSYAATIGLAAIVFGEAFLDLPGGDPAVPLYGFVFLIALGIDYSIFLMTRVREESVARGTRPGILTGLTVTGGVITSAGIVLAATFSALVTIPLVFMLQIAFIVAVGVLIDTLVVRTLLVPALSYDIGPGVWWPHRLSRGDRTADLT